METLGDLVTRDRRSDDVALVAPRENRRYDYHRFCTTVWKTGNFWRRRGLHEDATVAVADDPAPEVVFAFLGAALLGARTRFGLPGPRTGEASSDLDARLVVAPRDDVAAYEVPPGSTRVAYGGPPDDPAVAHFERDVWSENPAFPETPIDPGTVALVARDERDRPEDGGDDDRSGAVADREFSHADLLAGARTAADDLRLESDDEVALRAPLARPGAVAAGVLAPLLAGAAVLLPDGDAEGTAAVVAEGVDAPESRTVPADGFDW